MICHFCHIQMHESYWNSWNHRKFRCHNCPLETIGEIDLDDRIAQTTFQHYYFDYKEYRLTFVLKQYGLVEPYFILSRSTPITGHNFVLRLDYLPSISPYNVEKKLPTLLTFL